MRRFIASSLLLAALLVPSQGWAAIALVNSVSAGSAGGGVTTGSIDNTGANFLACAVGGSAGSSATVSDSSSNTWTPLTRLDISSSSVQLFYVANATVSNAQTFTTTGLSFDSIICKSFSGVKTASPADQSNSNELGAGDVSVTTGSVTPTEDNELILTGIGFDSDVANLGINSSFTGVTYVAFVGGQHYPVGMAYKIQTTAGADNPTWSWTNSTFAGAVITTFKAAASAAASFFQRRVGGQ